MPKRIVERFERTGGLLQVGYCWLFAPSVDAMSSAEKRPPRESGQCVPHCGAHTTRRVRPHLTQPVYPEAPCLHRCHWWTASSAFPAAAKCERPHPKVPELHGDESREGCGGGGAELRRPEFCGDRFMSWTCCRAKLGLGPHGRTAPKASCHRDPVPSSYKIYGRGQRPIRKAMDEMADELPT